MVAAQNATQRSLAESQEPSSASAAEESFSKDQIAQALGAKDPSWFRQTADRGVGSAAYRKTQVEDEDRSDGTSAGAQLPGMSVETSLEPPPLRTSKNTPLAPRGLASPLPLNPPRTTDGVSDVKGSGESLPGGRTSPTRSTSPTKGMGGFVQSAMMKRSDSVKRWSVTSPPSLTRADSVTANRASFHQRNKSATAPKPQNSSHDDAAAGPTLHERKDSDSDNVLRAADTSIASIDTAVSSRRGDEDSLLPSSPSKTMDPKRWSPTKSSWLESALNKPESPKPLAKPYNSAQPAWMVELNKNKAERASNPGSDTPKPMSVEHKHQVSIGGLMRSTPMGSASKPNITGLGGIYSPPGGNDPSTPAHGSKPSLSQTIPLTEDAELNNNTKNAQASEENEPSADQIPDDTSIVTSLTESTPTPKFKPETPPKKDLRSGLKQRTADSGGSKAVQPEFKNALGNLRRTKTQNYVAPDELKGNILRGKAGLSITDGPQKKERRDEFKDAILQKKDEFKKAQSEGKGVPRTAASSIDAPVPEGLARRAQIVRQKTGSTMEEKAKPEMAKKTGSPKPTPGPKRISSGSRSSPKSSSPAAKTSSKGPLVDKMRRVSTEPAAPKTHPESESLPALQKKTSMPSTIQGRAGGGKLADRFNPALAGLLARGPAPMAAGRGGDYAEESPSRGSPRPQETTEPTAAGPQLTHMTKGRARGPKRKAPTSIVESAVAKSQKTDVSSDTQPGRDSPKPTIRSTPAEPSARVAETPSLKPPAATPDNIDTRATDEMPQGFSAQQQVTAKADSRGRPFTARSANITNENKTEAEPPVPFLQRQQTSPERQPRDPSPLRPHKTGEVPSQPGSPKKLDMNRMSKFLDHGPSDFKIETAKEPIKLIRHRTGSISPVKAEHRPLPEPVLTFVPNGEERPIGSQKVAAVTSSAPIMRSPPTGPKPAFDRSSPRPETPKTPSRATARPLPMTPGNNSRSQAPADSPIRSPTKQASEISVVLKDFFGPQRPFLEAKVDPNEMLMRRPQGAGRISTKSVQMFQFSAEGKKALVPAHLERVLFDQEMYLCYHEFANENGWKKSEVYFWVGDEVAESTAADTALFATKEARFLGGRLITLQQGKETSEFIQALGGVVIVRRGSGKKHDSLASSMLCGRRYLGQVALDEVDFSSASLCAGFPYLVNHQGKCYLWKGKGSDVDEISAARLVGMDLTLTGELIEYDDGQEPDTFWQLFDGGSKPHSADHWRLKPNYSQYAARLFCSDSDSRQQVSIPLAASTLYPQRSLTSLS